MPATPIKITVKFVEPTEATEKQMETAWNYVKYDLHQYLNREYWPQALKALKRRRRKKAAGVVAPAAGSEKTSCPYQI